MFKRSLSLYLFSPIDKKDDPEIFFKKQVAGHFQFLSHRSHHYNLQSRISQSATMHAGAGRHFRDFVAQSFGVCLL